MQLPEVTLIIVDCLDARGAAKVLDICESKVKFGASKLLTSLLTDDPRRVEIPALTSLTAYSVFMLTSLHKYIDTEHVLVVQRDGWVLNADAWDPAWLKLDYIGPIFMQYDRVGSGGFSLRSKRIMEHAARIYGEFDPANVDNLQQQIGLYEDGVLSMSPEFVNFRVGSLEQAARFGQGGSRNPRYFVERPFGFHRTWQRIDLKTGIVDSSDTSADITRSYDLP